MGDSASSPATVATSAVNFVSNARIGMQREVYEAAEQGSVEVLEKHNNWKQEKTTRENNILHVHLGKPLEKNRRGVVIDHVCMSFIKYVVVETTKDSMLLQSNDNGDTPLHFAARFGHTGAVQEFLTRTEVISAGLLNKANKCNDTALHDAARAGHVGIVMMLVKEGGKNALHYMPNNLHETPLFLAAERGCLESFNSIVEHTDLTVLQHRGPCGQTPLHLAVLCGNKEIVDQILKIKTSSLLIRVRNDQGQTALHCCAAQNAKEQLKILTALLDQDDKYNSAVYVKDNDGRTALHIAILNLNFNGAQMLVRSYPDCIEMVDNKGWNLVHFAANSGCITIIEQLLKKVPKCDRLINEKDNNGNTPLHLLVATSPSLHINNFFLKLPMFIRRNKNLDVRVFNNKNLTAGNVMVSNDSLPQTKFWSVSKLLPKGRRIPKIAEDAESVNTISIVENNQGNPKKIEERIDHFQKVGETRLVVAALIATVSFTAGFTLPGGIDESPGETIGLAVLVKKASFIAFLISDTIAFTMSSLAVICYFILPIQTRLVGAKSLSANAYLLSTISLGALMIAFVTGVYTMVSQSPALCLIIIAISLCYFFTYCFLLEGSFKSRWNFYNMGVKSKGKEEY